MHAHSKGISVCSKIDVFNNILKTKEYGMDGFILTNHYQKAYVVDGDSVALAKRYIKEYHDAKEFADKIGFLVFFGIEVTLTINLELHLLIYGVSEEFLLTYSDIYDYPLEKIYKLVKEAGGILIQAHPMRREKNLLLPLEYLDGIEINCHQIFKYTHIDDLVPIAIKNDKLLTCGADYHADCNRPTCGLYITDDIKDMTDLVKYLKENNTYSMCVHEPLTDSMYDVTYIKGKELIKKI